VGVVVVCAELLREGYINKQQWHMTHGVRLGRANPAATVPGRTRGHAWQLTLFSRAVIVSGPDFADTLKLAGKDTDMEWCVGFFGGIFNPALSSGPSAVAIFCHVSNYYAAMSESLSYIYVA
jgi:hypothetical protein